MSPEQREAIAEACGQRFADADGFVPWLEEVIEPILCDDLRRRAESAEAALRVVPPHKLRALADWLDMWDRHKLAVAMGVTEAEVPDFMVSAGGEVQRDLRQMAELAAAASPEETT